MRSAVSNFLIFSNSLNNLSKPPNSPLPLVKSRLIFDLRSPFFLSLFNVALMSPYFIPFCNTLRMALPDAEPSIPAWSNIATNGASAFAPSKPFILMVSMAEPRFLKAPSILVGSTPA